MPVRIINQPYKVGKRKDIIYVETHKMLEEDVNRKGINTTPIVRDIIRRIPGLVAPDIVWQQLDDIVSEASGLPIPLLKIPRSHTVN